MAEAVTGMENLSTAVTFLITQFGNVVDTIIGTPILLLPVAIFTFGGAIGLANRLIRG